MGFRNIHALISIHKATPILQSKYGQFVQNNGF